jgi:uncharacterized membrane protein
MVIGLVFSRKFRTPNPNQMFEYLFTLRLLHIVAGAFWAGTAISMALFILPAIKAMGPDGSKMMQKIASTNRFPMVLTLASTLTILSGVLLFWEISLHLNPDWLLSNKGLVLTFGSLAAIVAYVVGFIVNKPGSTRLAKIGQEIAAAGGPPSPEQMAEITRIRQRMTTSTNAIALLLLLSVSAMAVVRYVY